MPTSNALNLENTLHKKIGLIAFCILLLLAVTVCDEENPVQPSNSSPVLSNLSVPDTLQIGSSDNNIISVKCEDADGLDDIDSVVYKLFNSANQLIAENQLFDDGNYQLHGDITPKNGRFSARVKEDLANGNYSLSVYAVDKAGARSNQLNRTFSAIRAIENNPPQIAEVHISDTIFVDKPVPFVIKVKATDADSADFIKKVTYQVFAPDFIQLLSSGELYDDGTHGDSLANDSIFSIEILSDFASWIFGNFNLYVQAFDEKGAGSPSLYKSIPWGKVEIGLPPVISDLNAPDTLTLPEDSLHVVTFVLSLRADDPDNPNDVKEVFFNTYKPDGTISKSSPLQMYDNGTSGDAVAEDQIYSLRVYLVYNNDVGDYRFEFQAKDYSDLLSNKITHIITVKR